MLHENVASGVVGFTDEGCPLVLSEHTCDHWLPGARPTLDVHTCWYCRWADFRKTTYATLAQSICRCPRNQVCVSAKNRNEHLEGQEGGTRHA